MSTAEVRNAKLKEIKKIAASVPYYKNISVEPKDVPIVLKNILPEFAPLIFMEQIREDLLIYPIYEALENWCDPKSWVAIMYGDKVCEMAQKIFDLYPCN